MSAVALTTAMAQVVTLGRVPDIATATVQAEAQGLATVAIRA